MRNLLSATFLRFLQTIFFSKLRCSFFFQNLITFRYRSLSKTLFLFETWLLLELLGAGGGGSGITISYSSPEFISMYGYYSELLSINGGGLPISYPNRAFLNGASPKGGSFKCSSGSPFTASWQLLNFGVTGLRSICSLTFLEIRELLYNLPRSTWLEKLGRPYYYYY